MADFQPALALVSSYIILSFSFFFVFIVVYLMCCRIRHRDPHAMVRFSDRFRSSGIDKKLIASLPLCRFSSLQSSRVGVDCAVCLTKFEDVDILHLLPKCSHAFHVSCIDAWLDAVMPFTKFEDSSCPLCRRRVEVGDIESFVPSSSFRDSSSRHQPTGVEFAGEEDRQVQSRTDYIGSSSATDPECSSSSAKRDDEDDKIALHDAEYGSKFASETCSVDGRLDLMYLNSQILGSVSIDAMGMER